MRQASRSQIMRCIQAITILLFAALLPTIAQAGGRAYPAIRPADISLDVSPSAPDGQRRLVIYDVLGNPAYELTITAASLNKRTTEAVYLSLTTAGRYAPDKEEKFEPNLMNSDYWGHGDGQSFRASQLCPANRRNPVSGTRRQYVLRKMKIVAEADNIELNGDQIVSLHLTVRVRPYQSGRSRPRDIPWGDLKPCGDASKKRQR